jgi:hypothetical protein
MPIESFAKQPDAVSTKTNNDRCTTATVAALKCLKVVFSQADGAARIAYLSGFTIR